jgi:hypothetical protein
MSDDEPPPLEDMSSYLAAKGIEIPIKSKPLEEAKKLPEPVQKAPEKSTFAPGIKKGFFNQGPKQPRKKPEPKEEIITIKPQQKKENPLVLKDVQQAMQYTNENTNEWLTPELLQRLVEHPFLAKGLSDQRLMKAVDELQKDPSLATTKYKHDQEVQVFFTEFSKIMADHFGRIAETKQKTYQDDPEVKAILQDPEVERVLKALQKGKPLDFHM